MTSKDTLQAGRLMGQIETLLDHEFLNCAYQGGMFADTNASMVTALAMAQSSGCGPSREERECMTTCHDELVRLVRSGLRLDQAIKQARKTQPASTAFNQFQASMLTRSEGSQA